MVKRLFRSRQKKQEGVKPMFYYPFMMPQQMGQPQQIDPFMLYKFVEEEKSKGKDKKPDENKKEKLWFLSETFTPLQVVLLTMTVGVIGGLLQLKLLMAFKQSLLALIQ